MMIPDDHMIRKWVEPEGILTLLGSLFEALLNLNVSLQPNLESTFAVSGRRQRSSSPCYDVLCSQTLTADLAT
jgi:hypothetical protein